MFAYVSGDTTARVATAGGWKKIIGEDHSLGDLGDVDMTVGGGPSDGQVIKWNATNSAWEPANDDSSGGGVEALLKTYLKELLLILGLLLHLLLLMY